MTFFHKKVKHNNKYDSVIEGLTKVMSESGLSNVDIDTQGYITDFVIPNQRDIVDFIITGELANGAGCIEYVKYSQDDENITLKGLIKGDVREAGIFIPRDQYIIRDILRETYGCSDLIVDGRMLHDGDVRLGDIDTIFSKTKSLMDMVESYNQMIVGHRKQVLDGRKENFKSFIKPE